MKKIYFYLYITLTFILIIASVLFLLYFKNSGLLVPYIIGFVSAMLLNWPIEKIFKTSARNKNKNVPQKEYKLNFRSLFDKEDDE